MIMPAWRRAAARSRAAARVHLAAAARVFVLWGRLAVDNRQIRLPLEIFGCGERMAAIPLFRESERAISIP